MQHCSGVAPPLCYWWAVIVRCGSISGAFMRGPTILVRTRTGLTARRRRRPRGSERGGTANQGVCRMDRSERLPEALQGWYSPCWNSSWTGDVELVSHGFVPA